MLDDKKLKEIERRTRKFMSEGSIKTNQRKEHVDFFLTNAHNSIATAQALYDLSTNNDFQMYTGHIGLNSFLWVVNAGYYAMFYMTRALLASEGIKIIADKSVHSLTFDALVNFFYLNNKLKKRLIESFIDAQEDASEILGQEMADDLVRQFYWEKKKRASLTYETGELAIQSKALTSLTRAKAFNQELRKIMGHVSL